MPASNLQPQFPITQWTEVVNVCQAVDVKARGEALAGICRDYWYPLYAFARRVGHSTHDAEDLTQSFFGYLVEHNVLATANRDLGKLRTFLLAVFQRHVRDAMDKQLAQKRGGGQELVSLDFINAEEGYLHEPADLATPERLFERAWALHVLRGALNHLRETETKEGRPRAFDAVAPFLDPETTGVARVDSVAQELGISLEAVRKMVSRMRRHFRDVLRQQIAATLRDPSESQIDEELCSLQAALRG